MTSPWTPSRNDYKNILDNQPAFRVDQLWHGLYAEGKGPTKISNLPNKLRATLNEQFKAGLVQHSVVDNGDTKKWLWELNDGKLIETVLMHYPKRSTVCISSQAGCAMGCGFCATGQVGYERNLSVGEIVEQLVAARAAAGSRRLSNVVFMGMGEPFANYPVVMTVIERLLADFAIGARHITVSTIGLVPQMLRFAEAKLQVGLAVSLHAANDDLRSELIPINRRHPLADVVAACQLYRERTGRRVSFEWAMIDNVNDRMVDADELIGVAKRAKAHINLIPLNPTPGWPTKGSPPERIDTFVKQIAASGVSVTVRKNRGTDIDAACGQLRASQTPQPAQPVNVRLTPPNETSR